jgi:hypothetical protein
MTPPARPLSPLAHLWAAGRMAALNLVLPITLAVALTQTLHHYLHVRDVRDVEAAPRALGPVTLRIKLPGTHAGIPEPLVCCGRVGNAALIFIRLLPGGQARVGVEFWGLELYQSAVFPLPAPDAVIDVSCAVPALFPRAGDPAWAGLTPLAQEHRLGEYIIAVNGTTRLRGVVHYNEPAGSPVYYGANPMGGSFVSAFFTGSILHVTRAF